RIIENVIAAESGFDRLDIYDAEVVRIGLASLANGTRIYRGFRQRKLSGEHCRKFFRCVLWPNLCRNITRINPMERLPVREHRRRFAVRKSEQVLRRYRI